GGKTAAVLRNLRRHPCLQRSSDGTEDAASALRSTPGTKQHSQSACRFHSEHSRRQNPQRHALPSSPSARYLWPLSGAHRGYSDLEGATLAWMRDRENKTAV